MYLKYVEINRRKAFKHLVELKRQDKNTFTVDGNVFSYVTKRGVTKKYKAINGFKEYTETELFHNHLERVNGFLFVEL